MVDLDERKRRRRRPQRAARLAIVWMWMLVYAIASIGVWGITDPERACAYLRAPLAEQVLLWGPFAGFAVLILGAWLLERWRTPGD